MPAPATQFLFSNQFNLSKAYLAAKLCQVSFADSVASLSDMKDAIGASTYTTIAGNGICPPAIVWTIPPSGYVVSWGGISCERQFLAYLAQSMLTTGSTHLGRCSNFVAYCYNTQKAAIIAAMGGGGASSPAINVFATGHSAGGAAVTLMAADLIKNYSTAFAVRGVYAFGSPKPGDNTFQAGVSSATSSWSIRHGSDPVCTWPSRGVGLLATATGGTLVGNVVFGAWNDYVDLQKCFEVYPNGGGAIGDVPSHGSTTDSAVMDLMRAFLENNQLPASHNINNYVAALEGPAAKEALSRGWTAVGDVLEHSRGVYGEVPDTQSDLASGSLPGINQFRQIPGLPTGATQTTGGGIIRLSGSAATLPTDSGRQRRPRARKFDGSTKKRCRRVLSLLRRIKQHDDSVRYGQGKSTQVLLDPAKMSEDELNAFLSFYEALNRVVGEWDI